MKSSLCYRPTVLSCQVRKSSTDRQMDDSTVSLAFIVILHDCHICLTCKYLKLGDDIIEVLCQNQAQFARYNFKKTTKDVVKRVCLEFESISFDIFNKIKLIFVEVLHFNRRKSHYCRQCRRC